MSTFDDLHNDDLQAEFNELVDERGLLGAIREFWDRHTSINLPRLGAILVAIWAIRWALVTVVGLSGLVAVVLSLAIVIFGLRIRG